MIGVFSIVILVFFGGVGAVMLEDHGNENGMKLGGT